MIDLIFKQERKEFVVKKALCFLAAVSVLLTVGGCAKTKTLHCDKCNAEIAVKENSDMNEEWGIYCDECQKEIFSEDM